MEKGAKVPHGFTDPDQLFGVPAMLDKQRPHELETHIGGADHIRSSVSVVYFGSAFKSRSNRAIQQGNRDRVLFRDLCGGGKIFFLLFLLLDIRRVVNSR